MPDDGYSAFAAQYEAGASQIVFRRVVADLETPIGTYLKLAEGRRHSFLLESVQDGSTVGRYSMIGLLPDIVLRVEQGRASINRNALVKPDAFEPLDAPPLEALRALVAESRIAVPEGLPSTAAGIYGYLGYDMVRFMEKLPDSKPDTLGLPDAILMRPSILAIFDTLKDELYLTAPVYVRDGVTAPPGVGKRAGADRRCHGAPGSHPALYCRPARHRRHRRHQQHQQGRVRGDGRPRQGVHPGRRYLPGCTEPALRGAVHPAANLALPGAAAY